MNAIVHLHDFNCGCNDPLECTILTIVQQEKNLRFTDQEKQQLQKCLTGTTEETTVADDAFGDAGFDLENLFTDDFGDAAGTAENTG